jgi:hypothetical protein
VHDVDVKGKEPPPKPTELVECYSGYRYGERPLALHWQGKRLKIEKVEIQERRRQGWFFRVLTDDEQSFELLYDESLDNWEIKSIS